MKRTLLASSHDGKYTYWQAPDLYVYLRNEITGHWIGWFCALSSWENTFSKAKWITLVEVSQ